MNSESYYSMVKAFHRKHNQPIGEPMLHNEYRQNLITRSKLVAEECHELVEAIFKLDRLDKRKSDLMHVAKEICDVMYVAVGTAVSLGIDIDSAFKEVHKSNMSKDVAVKIGGKVQKGLSYIPPNLSESIRDSHLPVECQNALRQESP